MTERIAKGLETPVDLNDFEAKLGALIAEHEHEGSEVILEALDLYITLLSEKQDSATSETQTPA